MSFEWPWALGFLVIVRRDDIQFDTADRAQAGKLLRPRRYGENAQGFRGARHRETAIV